MKYSYKAIGIIGLILLQACSSDSSHDDVDPVAIEGTGGASNVIQGTGGGEIKPQAKLGPVVNASVSIRPAYEPDAEPLCTTTTLESEDLEIAGTFSFSEDCLNHSSGLFIITVEGGQDIDFDDDNIIDATPTEVSGKFSALIDRELAQLEQQKVSIVTEYAYRSVLPAIQNNFPPQVVRKYLDQFGQLLLADDLNSDGVINYEDALLWDPAKDALSINAVYNSPLVSILAEVHFGAESGFTNETIEIIDDNVSRIDTIGAATKVTADESSLVVRTKLNTQIFERNNGVLRLLGLVFFDWTEVMLNENSAIFTSSSGFTDINLQSLPSAPIEPVHIFEDETFGDKLVYEWGLAGDRIIALVTDLTPEGFKSEGDLSKIKNYFVSFSLDDHSMLERSSVVHLTGDATGNGFIHTTYIDNVVYGASTSLFSGPDTSEDTDLGPRFVFADLSSIEELQITSIPMDLNGANVVVRDRLYSYRGEIDGECERWDISDPANPEPMAPWKYTGEIEWIGDNYLIESFGVGSEPGLPSSGSGRAYIKVWSARTLTVLGEFDLPTKSQLENSSETATFLNGSSDSLKSLIVIGDVAYFAADRMGLIRVELPQLN